ncbi:hypothetical protein D046_5832 [Vibrio parahaemolyticus V-223/04]|nr:hypothetical protein D046_5832 [Vibrio parahaemolyticus V-223/04]
MSVVAEKMVSNPIALMGLKWKLMCHKKYVFDSLLNYPRRNKAP